MQRPRQPRLQPARVRIDVHRRAQQTKRLVEAVAAEQKRGAQARDPRIVRQMRGARKSFLSLRQIAIHMKSDPTQRRQQSL